MVGLKPIIAGMPGGYEVWIILVIILLLFGRRIPQVARSLGQGISQFKKGLNEADGLLGGDDDATKDGATKDSAKKSDAKKSDGKDAPKDPPPSDADDS